MRLKGAATWIMVTTVAMMASACASESSDDPNTVEGIVTEVTGDLTAVESFVITDSDGRSHLFRPEPGLLFYGGPLSHIRDHIVTGQRVVVTFENRADGARIAVLIEHADPGAVHDQSG